MLLQRTRNNKSASPPIAAKSAFPLRTVDLFSGCGGLTLGLHQAGHRLLFAIEKDPMAFETFRANFLAPTASYPVRNLWPEWLDQRNHDIQ